MNKKIRVLGFVLTMLVILAVAGQGIKSLIVSDSLQEVEGYQPWDEVVLTEMRSLPVQDGGRIKPFQSLARRYMHAMHGRRSMKILVDGQKVKLTPTEWMMDVVFRPELAHDLPLFLVDNSIVLEQAGMDVTTLRDRYSFNQIKPYLAKLQEMFEEVQDQIDRVGKDSLSNEQDQLYRLMLLLQNYVGLSNPFILDDTLKEKSGFHSMADFFDSNASYTSDLEANQGSLAQMIAFLDGKIISDAIILSDVERGAKFSKLILNPTEGERAWSPIGQRFQGIAEKYNNSFKKYTAQVSELKQKHGELKPENTRDFFQDYTVIYKVYMDSLPPVQAMKEKIFNAEGQQLHVIERFPEALIHEIKALESLQLSLVSADVSKQVDGILAFKGKYADQIDFGDEGGGIEGEILLNNMSYFTNGIVLLIFAGVLMIAMCLTLGTKTGKILYWVVFAVVMIACLFTVGGIVHRSVIMNRSPIGTLYDTMPFIVGAGLILLLLIEWIHKRGVMLAVGIVFGVAILFLAKSFEIMDAGDTMDPLVAVLKSNYWLSTHVVMITLGYMGGIVAAIISHFYLIGRAFGVVEDRETKRYLSSIVYGMIGFTLLFSLIGTILGGIWAADSWGRFWGWDPKENGALMIVIWMLVILHARLGGYIREIGLHVCSVFGFVVIVFSWWHVNFLGVGLHNYGFTSADAMTSIWTFYSMEFGIMLVGIVLAIIAMDKKRTKKLEKQVAELSDLENA